MKNQTNPQIELHEQINLILEKTIKDSIQDNGRGLILLTHKSEVAFTGDDHARFTWVLEENTRHWEYNGDEAEEKEQELVSRLIGDMTHSIIKSAPVEYKLIPNPGSPATFLTSNSGDTLLITITDNHTIINLIYSGMY